MAASNCHGLPFGLVPMHVEEADTPRLGLELCRRGDQEDADGIQVASAQRTIGRTRAKALLRASEHYQAGDLHSFYETLSVASFRNSRASVSLADPGLPDCPLIGVSQGYEKLTGYSRSEIIGRNSRFLNIKCPMPAELRHELRNAVLNRKRFVGILHNQRKNGEVFCNLLHMSPLRVGNSVFLLGLQADVTRADVDLTLAEHVEELERVVDAIFASNVDAWAALQITNYAAAKPSVLMPYAEAQLVPRYRKQVYAEARSVFVALIPDDADTGRLRYSKTFLEVCDEGRGQRLGSLRRVYSEPAMPPASGAPLDASARLPKKLLLEWARELRGGPMGSESALAIPYPKWMAAADAEEVGIEREEEQGLTSAGSALHPNSCMPCSFHCYSHLGCNRGQSCSYCHMDHPKRTRRRGKRKPKGSDWAQASAESKACAEKPDSSRQQAQVPSLTSHDLMPLLKALQILSPLPEIRREEPQRDLSFQPMVSSAVPTGPSPPDDADARPEERDSEAPQAGIVVRYSENPVVLAKSEWKQVLPFVSGIDGPLAFSVHPPLPGCLSLHRSTGVISGAVLHLPRAEATEHLVTAEGAAGSAGSLTVRIRVVNDLEAEGGHAGTEASAVHTSAAATSEEE